MGHRSLVTLSSLTAWALGRTVHSAGLAGPLPWPGGYDFVTMCDAICHQLAAQRTRISRRPLHVVHVTRDRATGQGVDADDTWVRPIHLGPSISVADEREATVEAAAEHRLRAYDKQVRVKVCRGKSSRRPHGKQHG